MVMASSEGNQIDSVPWARRVNRSWIVHHGLKECAQAYLDHLEEKTPSRLIPSCRRAYRMVRLCPPGEDPKPWFYAGLFSLANQEETRRFLADHWFTRSCLLSLAGPPGERPEDPAISSGTREKINRIRHALVRLGSDS
jgi:hypothetical protein